MADTFLTAADLLKVNDVGVLDLGITDLLQSAPCLASLAATEATHGTSHKYLKETTAPVVGFRAVNSGRDFSDSEDTEVTITLAILDASFPVDKALADAYKRGGAEAYVAREAMRHMKASFKAAERQIIDGTSADATGFSGLRQAVTSLVVDAAGTTANTGSSVYFIRTMDDITAATFVLGNEATFDMGETIVQDLVDGSGKHRPVYYTPMSVYLGLAVGSVYSAARIKNITADPGKTLDDDMLSKALELFPADLPPTHIWMNRRSLGQLQRSRTTYSPTGMPAPRPTEYEGIPIIVTDQITSTEAIA